jgi:hypothetical protein
LTGALDAAEDASPVEAVEAVTRQLGTALAAAAASFLIAISPGTPWSASPTDRSGNKQGRPTGRRGFLRRSKHRARGRPSNSNGGQVGEAGINGLNGVVETVRLVRGTSVNQVANTEHLLVTAGSGVPTSGLIIGLIAESGMGPAVLVDAGS